MNDIDGDDSWKKVGITTTTTNKVTKSAIIKVAPASTPINNNDNNHDYIVIYCDGACVSFLLFFKYDINIKFE